MKIWKLIEKVLGQANEQEDMFGAWILKPFVKWVGGKRQLLTQIKEHIPEYTGNYFEPFLGGGAVFLELEPENAVVSDLNTQLISTYMWVRDAPEDLLETVERLDRQENTLENYTQMREHYNQLVQDKPRALVTSSYFIWLNKHCFNGVYRVNSKGGFNVPWNKKTEHINSLDEDNILEISSYLKEANVALLNRDYKSVLQYTTKEDFVYMDPPYVPNSVTASFTSYTKEKPLHDEIAQEFANLPCKALLSNNNNAIVQDLYADFNITEVSARRSINQGRGKEVLVDKII